MRAPARRTAGHSAGNREGNRHKPVQATAQLTGRYKASDLSSPAIATEGHRAAYLAVRLPATHASLRRVFEINVRAPQAGIANLLDLRRTWDRTVCRQRRIPFSAICHAGGSR